MVPEADAARVAFTAYVAVAVLGRSANVLRLPVPLAAAHTPAPVVAHVQLPKVRSAGAVSTTGTRIEPPGPEFDATIE